MKRATLSTLVALLAAATLAAPAAAALRATQIEVDEPANLAAQLNILDSSPIDANFVSTQQQDIQRWSKNISGTGTFTLSFELITNDPFNEIGIYNAVHAPDATVLEGDRFMLFPATAEQGWYVTATFNSVTNTMTVTRFDASDVMQGAPTVYQNVHVNDFGYYIGNGDVFGYGQDVANEGDQARALVYSGAEENEGGWYMCFEDGLTPDPDELNLEDQDFDEVILFIESVRPVSVNRATWSSLKSRFR